MKVGDLVRMKYEMWWRLKDTSAGLSEHRAYTDQHGIVYGMAGKGLKVLMPGGKIKVSLVDYWEVVNAR